MEQQNTVLTKASIAFATVALLCLLILHFVSPEFDPSWRMVSEYALGDSRWLLSIFFVSWGLSSILLSLSLWKRIDKLAAKIGNVLLFVSGIGASLAAWFDVSQPTGHGVAGLLGIPTVPIAALMLTYHLTRKSPWIQHKKPLLWLAHGTWVMVVAMVVAMIVMMNGFAQAGVPMGPDAPTPETLPDGVVAVVGYVNRLLILVDILWIIWVARISLLPGRT